MLRNLIDNFVERGQTFFFFREDIVSVPADHLNLGNWNIFFVNFLFLSFFLSFIFARSESYIYAEYLFVQKS